MTTPPVRYLIVNADDFGLSQGVNRGIIRAHDHGIVTSASLMVSQPGAADAAKYGRSRPGLSVGLHLDLGEWACRDGQWRAVYEFAPAADAAAVQAEVSRQMDLFFELMGRPPTHVDSHQHAHRSEPLASIARELAGRVGVPLRHFTPGIHYCGDFYGQTGKSEPLPGAITPEALARVIKSLGPGVTELSCHPGDDPLLPCMYRDERLAEVATLCQPTLNELLSEHAFQLVSFSTVPIELFRGDGLVEKAAD